MNDTKTSVVPMFYIEYYSYKNNRLVDISEQGYPTFELCQAAIEKQKEDEKALQQELLDQYEQEMKNFVFDLDTSDREPVLLDIKKLTYKMASHQYIHDENGHHEVTEHIIKDLNLLQATPEQIETVNYILNGTIDPETLSCVQTWITECYNKPSSGDLKLFAINHILEGYGIEGVRTSKWKNGYWCDILCTYINMGDSYIPTLIHHRKHGFMVASIGDVIEKNKHVI